MAKGVWARTDTVTRDAFGNEWTLDRADAVLVQRYLPTFYRMIRDQLPSQDYRRAVMAAKKAKAELPPPPPELLELQGTAGCDDAEIEVFAGQLGAHLISVDGQKIKGDADDKTAQIRKRLTGVEIAELWFIWIDAQRATEDEKKHSAA